MILPSLYMNSSCFRIRFVEGRYIQEGIAEKSNTKAVYDISIQTEKLPVEEEDQEKEKPWGVQTFNVV